MSEYIEKLEQQVEHYRIMYYKSIGALEALKQIEAEKETKDEVKNSDGKSGNSKRRKV
jgi:hypothetical protein